MPSILGSSSSGLVRAQDALDVVGHNLANVNTYAYKKVRLVYEGRPMPQVDPDAARLGVAEATQDRIFSQAMVQITENPFQFSIEDDAFFRLQDYDGTTVYSRFGNLETDSAGNVLAFKGRLLQPPITIPALWTQPAIDEAGVVSAIDLNGERQNLGQLTLAKFPNPQSLEALGDGLYVESANTGGITVGSGGSEGFAALRPGALEGSNVDVAEEFTNMIVAQRAYAFAAKTFSVADQMLALAANITQ